MVSWRAVSEKQEIRGTITLGANRGDVNDLLVGCTPSRIRRSASACRESRCAARPSILDYRPLGRRWRPKGKSAAEVRAAVHENRHRNIQFRLNACACRGRCKLASNDCVLPVGVAGNDT